MCAVLFDSVLSAVPRTCVSCVNASAVADARSVCVREPPYLCCQFANGPMELSRHIISPWECRTHGRTARARRTLHRPYASLVLASLGSKPADVKEG